MELLQFIGLDYCYPSYVEKKKNHCFIQIISDVSWEKAVFCWKLFQNSSHWGLLCHYYSKLLMRGNVSSKHILMAKRQRSWGHNLTRAGGFSFYICLFIPFLLFEQFQFNALYPTGPSVYKTFWDTFVTCLHL